MKLIARQKLWLAVVSLTNLCLWAIPSNVVEQIARDRQTLLGRYSRQHFTWIVAVLLISLVSFYIDWSTGERYKRRWFQVLAVCLLAFPGLFVINLLARKPEAVHYVQDHLAYHRPANAEFRVNFEDKPKAYRTYPNRPAGYGELQFVGHTDHRGYRNQTDLERYDIVVLGDSFAGGTRMPDDTLWPAQLARNTGLTVYNLGTSGYAPLHYLASLKRYGLGLRPRYVFCLLYEGNDFRSAKADRKQTKPSLSKRVKAWLKQSPILNTMDNLLIRTFGPLNSSSTVRDIEMLDWMPLAIPEGVNAKHYAFAPKQLRDILRYDQEEFAMNRHWIAPRALILEMNKLCRDAGAQLVLGYAPTKAHVTLPLLADRLPAAHVRAFTQLSVKERLPEADAFLDTLFARVEAKELAVSAWCARQSIPFIELTTALRDAVGSGSQVYFTYDQHWTPEGHEVVAEVVGRYFANVLGSDRSGGGP